MKNSMLKVSVVAFLLSLALIVGACASADPALVRAVNDELMCPCGTCNEALPDCECDTAVEVRTLVEKSLARGQSEEDLIQFLVNRYGSQVLAERSHS